MFMPRLPEIIWNIPVEEVVDFGKMVLQPLYKINKAGLPFGKLWQPGCKN